MSRKRLNLFGLRRFASHEDGSVSLEALILMPLVLWVYAAMFSIFETYEEYSLSDYLGGAHDLLDYITQSQGPSTLRVSSLQYDKKQNRFYVHWSRARGADSAVTDADVASWTNRLPSIPDDEYIVVTETTTTFTPPFNIGLGQPEIKNFVFTRPRYAPRVLYTGR
jgi:hypothetical protein